MSDPYQLDRFMVNSKSFIAFPAGERPFDITKPPPFKDVPIRVMVCNPNNLYGEGLDVNHYTTEIVYKPPCYDNWVLGGWQIPNWRLKIARTRLQLKGSLY